MTEQEQLQELLEELKGDKNLADALFKIVELLQEIKDKPQVILPEFPKEISITNQERLDLQPIIDAIKRIPGAYIPDSFDVTVKNFPEQVQPTGLQRVLLVDEEGRPINISKLNQSSTPAQKQEQPYRLLRGGINRAQNEVPSGTIDGANKIFTLANTPKKIQRNSI